MTKIQSQRVAAINATAVSTPQKLFLSVLMVAAGLAAMALAAKSMAAAPVAGDTFVYRILDGYNSEPRGQVSYHVDKTDAGRVFMSVSVERSGAQMATTEIYTPEGNWLRHSIINRDQPVDYEFAQAYPAYDLPLEAGKQWSSRVNAVNPQTGVTRSVRVDATIVGNERIRVPAGEFDTIKIKRQVYAGDAESYLRETNVAEMEWFAPALGRSVRLARNSAYVDLSRGRRNQVINGDWNIYELVSAPAK